MSVLIVLMMFCHSIFNVHAEAVPEADWRLEDLINLYANDSARSSVLTQVAKKAAGEFNKLYQQLEGVVKQLTSSSAGQMTRLDPNVINEDCSCYCRCPHAKVNTKVMDEVKLKVLDLKERFTNVGRTIKEKIHYITAR